jgi:hypothetical protein
MPDREAGDPVHHPLSTDHAEANPRWDPTSSNVPLFRSGHRGFGEIPQALMSGTGKPAGIPASLSELPRKAVTH